MNQHDLNLGPPHLQSANSNETMNIDYRENVIDHLLNNEEYSETRCHNRIQTENEISDHDQTAFSYNQIQLGFENSDLNNNIFLSFQNDLHRRYSTEDLQYRNNYQESTENQFQRNHYQESMQSQQQGRKHLNSLDCKQALEQYYHQEVPEELLMIFQKSDLNAKQNQENLITKQFVSQGLLHFMKFKMELGNISSTNKKLIKKLIIILENKEIKNIDNYRDLFTIKTYGKYFKNINKIFHQKSYSYSFYNSLFQNENKDHFDIYQKFHKMLKVIHSPNFNKL